MTVRKPLVVVAGTPQEIPSGDVLFGVREVLTADRTYYVATTGSDSNDGLSVGTPFLTIQKAMDAAATLDTSIYDVTISVADGTYTSGVVVKPLVGAGLLYLTGNVTTPANVLISTTSGPGVICPSKAGVVVSGLKITTTTAGFALVANGAAAAITFNTVDFGACAGGQCYAGSGGVIQVNGNYTISGGAPVHVQTGSSGFYLCINRTVTLTGTPAFSAAFVYQSVLGGVMIYGNTYIGSATGARYNISLNSVCLVNGAGTTYLPGNTSGTTATGGQYA